MPLPYLTLLIWILGYAEFGLAMYACINFLDLILAIYKSRDKHPQWLHELMQVCLSFLGIMLLDGCRAIWDGTHEDKFPIVLSFFALAMACVVVGRGASRIKNNLSVWIQKNQGLS